MLMIKWLVNSLNVDLNDAANVVITAIGGTAIFFGDRARGRLTDEVNRAIRRLDDRHASEPTCKDALYRCCHSIREAFSVRYERFEVWRGLRGGPQQRMRVMNEEQGGSQAGVEAVEV